MSSQSCVGSSVPMSDETLSFTVVQFLYSGLSLRTRWKSATFRCGANFEPLSSALPEAIAFSSILSPLNIPPPLRLAYSLSGEFMGFTVVPHVEMRSGRVLPMLRRVLFCHLTVASSIRPLAHLLVRVFQPYYTLYYLTKL